MEQLSLFPTVYEVNMRKKKIWQMYENNEFNQENLDYVIQTIDMMIDLNMHCTSSVNFFLSECYERGYRIPKKYEYYVIDSCKRAGCSSVFRLTLEELGLIPDRCPEKQLHDMETKKV